MALGIYTGVALTPLGGFATPAAGATVEVKREDTNTLAAIFSDRAGTAALANPTVTDDKGRFQFYAAPLPMGYQITVTSGSAVVLTEPLPGNLAAPNPLAVVTYALRNQQVNLDASAFGMTVLDDGSPTVARTTLDAQEDLTTAKGDLIVGGAGGIPQRKPVGTDGSVLTADSTQADGTAWSTALATNADSNAIAYAIALG